MVLRHIEKKIIKIKTNSAMAEQHRQEKDRLHERREQG